MSIRHFLAVVLLSTASSNAQNPLPLENGNMWEYRSSDPMDPSRLRMAVIGDTVLPNSRNYFHLSGSLFMSPYLRLDSSRVYAYSGATSSEFKLFDFLAQPGDTITFLNGGAQTILLRSTWVDTTISRRVWYFVLYQGQPPNWYEFIEWWIQDSLGLAFLRGEPGMSWYLTGARIAGDTIGTLTSVADGPHDLPTQPTLLQNYPNPFNPATTIEFVLPREQFVVVKIVDLLGREVDRIFSGRGEQGRNAVQWSGSGHATGIYFVLLETGEYRQARKLVLLK